MNIDYTKYGITEDFLSQYEYPDLKPLQQDWRWSHKYAYDVLKGNIISCQKVKWAAIRHFKDLRRDDLYFSEQFADEIVRWFSFIPQPDGKNAGSQIILDPAQIFLCVSLIAWRWADNTWDDDGNAITVKGERRFTQFLALVSRKWGKSTLIAGLILYCLRKGAHKPRGYTLATKKDQAKLVWDTCCSMIKLSKHLKKYFTVRANDILIPSKNGELKPLASDSNSLDGLNPIVGCLDECHAIKDSNLYGVMVSAFGAQTEFLFGVITTAGFILQGLCTDLYRNGAAVLNPDNDITQDNYFYLIFEIDKGDDWSDPQVWYKSNPSMVYGRPSMKYMRERYQEATMSTQEKGNFLTKHCNLFVSGSDKWLDMDDVKSCFMEKEAHQNKIEQYKQQRRKCYGAVDRARVGDICSFAILFPDDDGGITMEYVNLLSQQAYANAGQYLKEVYNKAVDEGDLTIVRTNTVRDEQVEDVIREFFKDYNLEAFYYDPWHMRQICENLEEQGFAMVSVSQGTGNMSEPAKNLEGLISERKFRYNSRLLEFAAECALIGMTKKNNVEVFRDPANWKTEKIDPLISTIIALSGATLIKIEKNIYEDRGLFSV